MWKKNREKQNEQNPTEAIKCHLRADVRNKLNMSFFLKERDVADDIFSFFVYTKR